jgi:hypothetical protein
MQLFENEPRQWAMTKCPRTEVLKGPIWAQEPNFPKLRPNCKCTVWEKVVLRILRTTTMQGHGSVYFS